MASTGRAVRSSVIGALMCVFVLVEAANLFALVGAIRPITKIAGALSDTMIKELADLSKTSGVGQVGQILGKLKLSDEILEDTYLRVAIQQGTILRREAEDMYASLSRVPGFRTTLRKITSRSLSQRKGHLNELKIANEASKHGFDVLEIGRHFKDPIKQSTSDIDVILKRGDRLFPMEVKDYDNFVDMIMLRQDMDTLVAFKNSPIGIPKDNIIPVFTLTNGPTNPQVEILMIEEAQKRGVELIFGTPLQQVEKIKLLESII